MQSRYRKCPSGSERAFLIASAKDLLLAIALATSAASASAQTAAPGPLTQEPATTLAEAHQKLVHGQEKEAIGALQQLASAHPPVQGANRELGVAYYRMGRLEDAEKSFAAAMAEDPRDAESEQMRGLTLYRLNRRAAAVPFLEHARQWIHASNVDVNYVLGRCYIDAKRYDDARAAFAAQYGFGSESGSAYLLLAQMLLREELPQLAEENAKGALRISPHLALAHFILGKIYLARGDTAHALEEFEQERNINPSYPPVYEFLGDLYTKAGQFQKAQHSLTEALSLDQTSTGPFVLMGKLFLEDNDPQTAASYLEHAEQMDSSNFITHYLLGRAYQQMGKKEEAKRELNATSAIHSDENRSLQ
jgi:tetratricopeptide (TPR) repeat protein